MNNGKWTPKPLIKIAPLQRGFDLPVQSRVPGSVPVFAANGPVGTHSVAKVKGPGVVTGRSGTIGQVHYVESDYWPLNTSLFVTDFCGNDPKFIFYLLKTLRLERYCEGTGVPTLNRNNIHGIQVPLPPLPEQRRIATILDKADSIRRKREEGIRLTENLLRSTFLAMFGDPEKQSKWNEKSLGEVVDVASGQVDPKEEPYSLMQHVGGDNITSHTGEISGTATAKELGLISGKYEFTPQDVLYSKIRPALNKVACPDFAGICSADIYPIRPRSGEVSREFLVCLLRSDGFLAYATKHSSRTNIPKINRPALLAFQAKLPPFSEQLRFDAIAQRIREMKHHRLAASKVTDSCFDALVQRAFRGELTTVEGK